MLSRVVRSRALSSSARAAVASQQLNARLSPSTDPELFDILEKEKRRQRNSVVLIASENYAPRRVLDTLGTVMVSLSSSLANLGIEEGWTWGYWTVRILE